MVDELPLYILVNLHDRNIIAVRILRQKAAAASFPAEHQHKTELKFNPVSMNARSAQQHTLIAYQAERCALSWRSREPVRRVADLLATLDEFDGDQLPCLLIAHQFGHTEVAAPNIPYLWGRSSLSMATRTYHVVKLSNTHHLIFGIGDVHLMLRVRWLCQLGYM